MSPTFGIDRRFSPIAAFADGRSHRFSHGDNSDLFVVVGTHN